MRWGLVGTGPWASAVHAPSLSTHEDVRFVGVWGRSVERVERIAAASGVDAFHSFDQLLDKVDALAIAVAPSAQISLAAKAMSRGKHLLLEKPVGLDTGAVARLARDQPDDVDAAVLLTRILEPTRRAWLRTVMSGSYSAAELVLSSSALQPGSPYAESKWRHGRIGAMRDAMPHVLSQLVPVLGDVAVARARPTAQTGVAINLEHVSGARSEVRISLNADSDGLADWIRFSGSSGVSYGPTQNVDRMAAHRDLVTIVTRNLTRLDDPLVRFTTLPAAVTTSKVIDDLARSLESADTMKY